MSADFISDIAEVFRKLSADFAFVVGGFSAVRADSIAVIAEIFHRLTAGFAFLVGGVWVVMNYVRNRTHVPRLQVEVKAEFTRSGDRQYLVATCQAKNVGLSVILLPEREPGGVGLPGTELRVRMLSRFAPEAEVFEVPWDSESASFEIFANHEAIEPGLTITEQKLIYQPDLRYDASWLQLRVSAHDEKWSAIAVAVLPAGLPNPVAKPTSGVDRCSPTYPTLV
jgi:hypothetical protein